MWVDYLVTYQLLGLLGSDLQQQPSKVTGC